MKYKYIIWDWNGTLFDDIQISVDAMNNMLKITGYDISLTLEKYKEIFCFPVIEYYRRAGFDFGKHSFDELAQLYIEQYSPMQNHCNLFDGALMVLDKFKSAGLGQAVISVCKKERLAYQIGLFGIENYFDTILGTDDNYAVSKIELAKKYFKDSNIKPSEVLFIGDTTHDCEVANAVGCSCVLVSAGHQSRDVLQKTGADILESISDLPNYIL